MIAVDWGGSSLRAWRLDEAGAIIDQRRSDQGVLSCDGAFAGVLDSLIDGWNDTVIVLSGMIGSRSGWHEMPYVDCPAGLQELAASMQSLQFAELPGRTLWFVPGVADHATQMPDVVRGEESQLLGLPDILQPGEHVICLPGTHSKWLGVCDGRIRSIHTAMTGEVYALLRQHSILGKLMDPAAASLDGEAFDTGVQRSAAAGGLLHHLFGVRTNGLFERFSARALPSYLSGLLTGHEIRAAMQSSHMPHGEQVHLIGSEHLLAAYSRALLALDLRVVPHPEQLAANGMHALWQSRSRMP